MLHAQLSRDRDGRGLPDGGAARIELCSSLIEGGITPSVGLLQVVKENIQIPVYVMIRPRGGDFLYSERELEVMRRDIELLKRHRADGFVLGALTEDGRVDSELCMELLATCRPLPVTFHRAFDMVHDPAVAVETLVSLGFERILTSGCDSSALEGLPVIKRLVEQVWDCAIDLLPSASPPKGWIYPLSLPESKAMEEYIESSLAAGHIRPSTSPAAAGFFFVGKKDGGLRPCIDYRGLNAVTVWYPYPLPLVPAALEQLRGAQVFTKLDRRSVYNLVRIREGDEWKTAFHTTHGHYEYCVMPFAPAVFQALINEVFRDLLGRGVIAYIDDILVYSASMKEHVIQVREVLTRLQQHHLYVKLEKCEFHRSVVTFLGYVILHQGVEMDTVKVQAVTEWPEPPTVRELQRFLGFANFNDDSYETTAQ
ncbi:hypothetical protein QTP70_003876 [Hemibagrus guttatus]|uniref:Copper homeostasis protein cutC homolog n=1 Tax=Hemibagrus guttatus TaxID=175788 RepID=A0AAE0PRV5_9TELE|nr:hypothetical protein QTP70_003876 [Hemibagrus guttatus]